MSAGVLDLEAIKAREAAATPGPWTWERVDVSTEGMADTTYQHVRAGHVGVADTFHNKPLVIEGHGPMAGYLPPRHGNVLDANFIANARDDVPALITEVERLRARIAAAEDELREALAKPATLTAADCVARAFASLGSDASTKAVRRG